MVFKHLFRRQRQRQIEFTLFLTPPTVLFVCLQEILQGNATQTSNIILVEQDGGTDLFTLSNSGLLSTSDLTLGLNDTSATISTNDTDEDLTLDPNGNGNI